MKLKLPKKKLFQDALKNNKWPVNWFDQKKDKERKRQAFLVYTRFCLSFMETSQYGTN